MFLPNIRMSVTLQEAGYFRSPKIRFDRINSSFARTAQCNASAAIWRVWRHVQVTLQVFRYHTHAKKVTRIHLTHANGIAFCSSYDSRLLSSAIYIFFFINV